MYTRLNTLGKKKKLEENIAQKGEIAQNEQFHLFPQCFLCNLYLKSFTSHISETVVVCSFFEFGTVSKWCTRDRVNLMGECYGTVSAYTLYNYL